MTHVQDLKKRYILRIAIQLITKTELQTGVYQGLQTVIHGIAFITRGVFWLTLGCTDEFATGANNVLAPVANFLVSFFRSCSEQVQIWNWTTIWLCSTFQRLTILLLFQREKKQLLSSSGYRNQQISSRLRLSHQTVSSINKQIPARWDGACEKITRLYESQPQENAFLKVSFQVHMFLRIDVYKLVLIWSLGQLEEQKLLC